MRWTYLVINLVDVTVRGSNDAEELEDVLHDEDHLVICTTGNTSYMEDGEMTDVPALVPEETDDTEDDEAEED